MLIICLSTALLLALFPLIAATPSARIAPAKSSIPYVPTRHDTVRDLLWLADVGTNDVVYDLGSGDGRIVIAAVRDFHARKAVGIEIDPDLVLQSREKAAEAGLANRVEFRHGDLFTNNFSDASVVVLYLGQGPNLDLRPQLVRTLKPGARIVSHQFGLGEWPSDKVLEVRTALLGMYGEMARYFRSNLEVPDYVSVRSQATHDTLSVWIVPAGVAGVWRGKVRTESGEAELKLTLHQRLSGVTGSFQFEGRTNYEGHAQADLWGDHFRVHCASTGMAYGQFLTWFEGHVRNETMTGTLWICRGNEKEEVAWIARRDTVDLPGTWEWTGATNSRLQLRVERRDGRLAASYHDGKQTVPVRDFYDFGGGFYFTLLLGLEGNSYTSSPRRMGPEDGWVIGEGVATNNTMSGTIAFYSYPDWNKPSSITSQSSTNNRLGIQGRSDWIARRKQ